LRFVAVGRTMKFGLAFDGFVRHRCPPSGRKRATRDVSRTAAVGGFEAFDDTSQPVRLIRKEVKDDQEEAPLEG
jgi:hypothetical protein